MVGSEVLVVRKGREVCGGRFCVAVEWAGEEIRGVEGIPEGGHEGPGRSPMVVKI